MKPTILTCAIVGASPMRKNNPAIPYTPAEIAGQVIEAAKAGASIAHVHVRNPETGAPSMEVKYYRETVERIRESGIDIVLNLTAGPGGRFEPIVGQPSVAGPLSTMTSPDRRVEHVLELKPEICTIDLNTTLAANGKAVTINFADHITRMAELIQAEGVKPELEAFCPSDLVLADDLIAKGVFTGPQMFQLVLGVKYGAPATTQMMQAMLAMLPAGSEWAGFGISRLAFPMLAQSVILGGHARMGFEDNIYMERGKLAPGNGALIEKAARMVEDLGQTIATPAETREILGLRTPS